MTVRTPIFLVSPDSGLVRMKPSAPANEDDLQALIAKYPELIGDSDGALLLIDRERVVPDSMEGTQRWSLDHLFVTREATPVLVEVKRAVDTRLRREVVGQLLDYAANGVVYWPPGSTESQFREACKERNEDADQMLSEFLGESQGASKFWSQVDANLRDGRIKLVFVADEIPGELARIVEFLNDQMRADVRAIELSYFEGPDGVKTLAPRVIGETERARVQKSGSSPKLEPISIADWMQKHIAPLGQRTSEGASTLLRMMEELAGEASVASTQGSIYSRIMGITGKYSYPIFLVKNGTAQLGFGYLTGAPALEPEEARRAFYERFAEAVGPLSTPHLKGFPSFPLERLSDPARLEAFRKVAQEFCEACRMDAGGAIPAGATS